MNEWRQAANTRRETRQTLFPEFRSPASRRKDRKKWCRGKVGTLHKTEWRSYETVKKFPFPTRWKILVCNVCGKHLRFSLKGERL